MGSKISRSWHSGAAAHHSSKRRSLRRRFLRPCVSLEMVISFLRRANSEGGGRVIDFGSKEFVVRARGHLKSITDLQNVVVMTRKADAGMQLNADVAHAVTLRDIAQIEIGPEMRRGMADLDGQGEAVGGIVIMRQNANVASVIGKSNRNLRAFNCRPELKSSPFTTVRNS